MSDFGVKMSTDNVNVKTATATQTRYSSKWANLKLYTVLSVNVSVSAGTPNGTANVANPLSYAPFFIAFISSKDSTSQYRLANQTDLSIAWEQDTNLTGCTVEYDANNTRFNVSVASAGGGSYTYNFRIVVFIDKLTGTAASVASGGDLGVRVSNSTKPVRSAADTDLSMTSEFKNLTVNIDGTPGADVTWNGSAYTPNVTHGLGYVPIFLCWFQPTGDATWGSRFLNVPTTNTFNAVFQYIEAWADTDKLYFQTDHSAPAERFRYLIFYEQLV